MNKKEVKDSKRMKNIKRLNSTIQEYIDSGIPMSEFIKMHLFEEYKLTGNKELEEMAIDYFIDHLD